MKLRQLKEKVEVIQGDIMVPPKMEITNIFKTFLKEQGKKIVQANSQNLVDGKERFERNIERRISVMQTYFKKELHDMIQNLSVKDKDMIWKNKYHPANKNSVTAEDNKNNWMRNLQ